jgi:hypothetical protein
VKIPRKENRACGSPLLSVMLDYAVKSGHIEIRPVIEL